VIALVTVHFALGSLVFIFHHTARTDRLVETIHGESDTALRKLSRPALLLYETDCSQRMVVGWMVSSFARKCLLDSCSVVTLPRPSAKLLTTYQNAYSERDCWYYHRDADTFATQLTPCSSAVWPPESANDKKLCPMLTPTATKLGF
jgi:hypothetical protein